MLFANLLFRPLEITCAAARFFGVTFEAWLTPSPPRSNARGCVHLRHYTVGVDQVSGVINGLSNASSR